jgi:uncharacterized protein (TIGR02266 family)
LERELAAVRVELAAVRAERDELLERLRTMEERPTISPPSDTLLVLDPPLELLDAEALAPLPAGAPSAGESEPDAGPTSLSGLQVSLANRRHDARRGCEFEVAFLGDSHLIAGLSQDISEGGVFVATYQQVEIGSAVTLGLELPSGRVEVQGVVRWTRPELEDCEQRPGFGVAFSDLSPEALAALREFCRSEPPRYYDL